MCWVLGGGAGWSWAADVEAIRRAIADLTAASRAMVEQGERGDLGAMSAEADRVVRTGERALAALPQPGNRHARDAAEHIRRAVEEARRVVDAASGGRSDDALAHARSALRQVRRGAGHAEAL